MKEENNLSFFKRLEEIAQIAGSVNALSVKSGVPQSTLRNYFKGGEPGRPHLIALAKAGGKSVEWLATGSESTNKAKASNSSNAVAGSGKIETHGSSQPPGNALPQDLEAFVSLLKQAKNRRKALFHCMNALMEYIDSEDKLF